LLFWSRWPLTGETLGILLVGVLIYFVYVWRGRVGHETLRFGSWLVVYLVAMAALSYLGDSRFGGIDVLPWGWDLAAVTIASVAIYYWGVRQGVAFDAARRARRAAGGPGSAGLTP